MFASSSKKFASSDVILAPAGCNINELIQSHSKNARNKFRRKIIEKTKSQYADDFVENEDTASNSAAETSQFSFSSNESNCAEKESITEEEDERCSMDVKLNIGEEDSIDKESIIEEEVEEEETSDSQMKVDPHCQCSKCSHWINSIGWENVTFSANTAVHLEAKPVIPLLKISPNLEAPKIHSLQYKNLSSVESKLFGRVLVHGETIPTPIKDVSDACLHSKIHDTFKNLKWQTTLPIQSYVWPSISKHLNVCIIGDPRSGKTMSYLPFICSFALHKENYSLLSKFKQPIIIILCNTSEECEEIFNLMYQLFEQFSKKPKVVLMTYPLLDFQFSDILITTPPILIDCIKKKIVNLKSLCHLVLENIYGMLKQYSNEINEILQAVNRMLDHRVCSNQVQLIMTSEKWSLDIERLAKKLECVPLICIENYVEAAIYSQIDFQVKLSKIGDKSNYLIETLKDKFSLHKCVVICDKLEINELKEKLTENELSVVCISEDLTEEEILVYETKWKTTKDGFYKVLLCTDFIFGTMLTITDAEWLIHYSFPCTWTRFVKRFVCMLDNFSSPLADEKPQVQCQSFIIIDETAELQLPKLLSLFNRFDKTLMSHFRNYLENLNIKKEKEKVVNEIPLCRSLKLFGKCTSKFCPNRHTFDNSLDIANDMPKYGTIRFKIVEMLDVTHYRINLIEHIIENEIRKFDEDNIASEVVLSDDMAGILKPVEVVQIGKIYAYYHAKNNQDVYYKCEVIEMHKAVIKIKLLNNGVIIKTLVRKILELPENSKPVEIYLANFIPPYKDANFCSRSFVKTRKILQKEHFKNIIFTANIRLQLNNAFWVDRMVEMTTIDNMEVVRFNLSKQLKYFHIVEEDDSQLKNLHELCANNDITLPSYKISSVKLVSKCNQIKPQWSFLDVDGAVQKIILCCAVSPGEFYVRHFKFYRLLESLHRDIENLTKNSNFNKTVEVVEGRCYLAPDPKEQEIFYDRILVKSIRDNEALCYFVDYGDDYVVNISDLRHLPNEFISKLPFQAIKCRLYGIGPIFDKWNVVSTDVLYKFAFEPDTDIWRSLFVKVVASQNEFGNNACMNISYDVILKDAFGEKQILINNILVDCGFAQLIKGADIQDFSLPETDESDSFEEKQDHENSEGLEDFGNFDEMELFVIDDNSFLENYRTLVNNFILCNAEDVPDEFDANNAVASTSSLPAIEYKNNSIADLESTSYFTPDVFWSQNNKTIKMKISLVGISNYTVNITRGVRFIFHGQINDKTYKLNLLLFKRIKNLTHSIVGRHVQVILEKGIAEMWPRLTSSVNYMRNLHYEFSASELEEPKKKFLQLDIPDDEEKISDDDDNVLNVFELSDFDSDEDAEISEDSD